MTKPGYPASNVADIAQGRVKGNWRGFKALMKKNNGKTSGGVARK